ncbi:MAG: porin [Ferruginibacter sp.]|nr:porin [Ferruginibacter sp.]
MLKKFYVVGILLISTFFANAQFLMDMVDTTKEAGKSLLSISKKFDHLKIGGYIQPQYQVAQSKGAKSFEGGDFSTNTSNRFMLRRSRVRIDYVHFTENTKPSVQIVFQFDANERAFTVRDVWGRVFENKWKVLSLTTGMFARPFGYEVNLSSSDRESPERGRMSQLLMKSERDIGAMLSFDVRKKQHRFKNIKIDIGVFNGQGINAPTDFDNYKDIIGRVSLKPIHLSKKITLSAGTSILHGGLLNNTKYTYTTQDVSGIKKVVVDSSITNIGTKSARQYYGIDAQLKIKQKHGFTELRAEFVTGKQTGLLNSTETPVALLTGNDGFHVRQFNGAYFYLLHNIFSPKHQLIVKYDWYDPNTKVSGKQIGTTGSGFTATNIKYSTMGLGYLHYITDNVKLVLYYAKVKNENTLLNGYTKDVKDDVFTCRLQFRF